MKRPAVILSAALAATVIAGILTTGGAAQVPGERTFKIIEGSDSTFKFIDNAPKARNPRNPRLSVGDAYLFTTPLFNEGNQRIGTLQVYCVVTRGGRFPRSRSQCNGTYALRDGTLAASAVVRGGENPTIAVVGGTGAYEGARGSITDRDLPRGRTEATVHLLP
jgi:allene oxide cyclase-like protein